MLYRLTAENHALIIQLLITQGIDQSWLVRTEIAYSGKRSVKKR